MHIFPLTLWCSTIGMNLSLHFVLFVTDNTGFPLFGEKGKMLCFKHRRFSPWPPRSIFRGVTIFWKVTHFPHNFISKIRLRISSWTFNLWMRSPMFRKQNETVNNSKINKTKQQSFPPSHTFPLVAKCRENLVRPVNSIHFHVVSLKNSRLSNKSLCPSPSFLTLRDTWPWSFALPAVVIMDTTLLSTHCRTKQGESLTQRIYPRSLSLAHSLLFLRAAGKLHLESKIVPVARTSLSKRCLIHYLPQKIRPKLTTFIFLLISLQVFTAVFQASSHLKEG